MSHGIGDKHVLVSGGSRGIGFAIAQRFVTEGARVSITGRDLAAVNASAARLGGNSAAFAMDVESSDSVMAAFDLAQQHHGAVDILINNAGQVSSQPFAKTGEDLWLHILNVNLTGVFRCTQAALPGMLSTGWGRIVNIASTAGLIGYAYVAAYCASKHGVIGLTRALAKELAAKPITVNAVCPGYTETDMVQSALATIQRKTGRSEQEARAAIVANNPQGRLVTPEEVAHCVLWLCQPGSESVTGQAISVSGGEVMS